MRAAKQRGGDLARKHSDFLKWSFSTFERFCALLDIVTKDVSENARRPFKLNRIQRKFLKEVKESRNAKQRRHIILKARQIGMTTLLLALDLYYFLTVRGARVVVVCQSDADDAQKGVIAGPMRTFIESLKNVGVPLDDLKSHPFEWHLPSRNSTLRIIGAGASEMAAAKAGRAGTITHLHATEIAFWEYASETLTAMMASVPPAAKGSWIVFESTPNGASGQFYDRCKAARFGDSEYAFHFYPWFDHEEYAIELEPGEVLTPELDNKRELWLVNDCKITPEQFKYYRNKVTNDGQSKTDQEFPSDPDSCFLSSGRLFFDMLVTRGLQNEAEKTRPIAVELGGALRIWKRARKGVPTTRFSYGNPTPQYIIGADVAEGIDKSDSNEPKTDFSTAIVLDRETGEHVATYHARITPEDFAAVLDTMGRTYNNARVAVERNNHGHEVLLGLKVLSYPNVYEHTDERRGWPTTPITRPLLLDEFAMAHREGFFKTKDLRLLDEMTTFIIYPNGRPDARRGKHDDLILGAAIAWYVRAVPLPARGMGQTPLPSY